ncbi:uncharacterized protein SRS1_13415 [Sporisorium reilianum f. sp. reilianum]|uniref:Uncharacterized protein n=1 Tax=Sporisorium reilianum f. sp. reilianum TaxID=72559 RepID=A0A2N8UCA7_9BASI|nr:uncharacterized protein SRS1_13415 [Sporisorium reilianum f. sp. reilianum]
MFILQVALTVVTAGPDVDEKQSSSDSQALVAKPSKEQLRVEYWWEEVKGTPTSLSVEYLLDLSTPWMAEAFKHVFVPHYSALASRQTTDLTTKERAEIVLEISQTFKRICLPSALKQPCVSFVGQEVHLASLSEALLEAFWKSPPVFKGDPMKFVTRGLPFGHMKTWYAVNIAAMSRDELIRKIDNATESEMKLVLASLYQVKGIPGSPMFGGDVYIHSAYEPGYYYDGYDRSFMGSRLKCVIHT